MLEFRAMACMRGAPCVPPNCWDSGCLLPSGSQRTGSIFFFSLAIYFSIFAAIFFFEWRNVEKCLN